MQASRSSAAEAARCVRLVLDAAAVLAAFWAAAKWKVNPGWFAVAGVAGMWLAGQLARLLADQPEREHPLIVLAQGGLLAWAAWWLCTRGARLVGWASSY